MGLEAAVRACSRGGWGTLGYCLYQGKGALLHRMAEITTWSQKAASVSGDQKDTVSSMIDSSFLLAGMQVWKLQLSACRAQLAVGRAAGN